MKRKKNIWEGLIIGIFIFLVIVPILTILVWVGTERWAWPSLIPQKFSIESGEWNTEKQAAACATLYVQSFHIGFGRVPVGCDRNNDGEGAGML